MKKDKTSFIHVLCFEILFYAGYKHIFNFPGPWHDDKLVTVVTIDVKDRVFLRPTHHL